MLPFPLLAAWLGLWAGIRLLLGLPSVSKCLSSHSNVDLELELEWWRATVRCYSSDGATGCAASAAASAAGSPYGPP